MNDSRKASVSALAAISGVAAMIGCCLPLPVVLLAGGLAASGWLLNARPYLLIASLVLVGYALFSLYRKKTCAAQRPWWAQALVWTSLTLVAAFAVFPQWSANRMAGSAATLDATPASTALPVRTIANLDALRASFNAAAGETRVIALLSPT